MSALEPLLTPREVQQTLRCSERTLHRLIKRNKIAVVRIGRSLRFEQAEIERYITQQKSNRG